MTRKTDTHPKKGVESSKLFITRKEILEVKWMLEIWTRNNSH